jgi:hypothetical protein
MEKTYPDFDRNNFEVRHADGPGTSHAVENTLQTCNKVIPGQCCDEPQMKGHNWKYAYQNSITKAIAALKKYDRCQVNAKTCRCIYHQDDACIHL